MLLIDNGNTRTKFAVYQQGKVVFEDKIVNQELDQALTDTWLSQLRNYADGDVCVGCSVGEKTSATLIQKRLMPMYPHIHWLKSELTACGVTNGYGDNAQQLGADRWFALLGYYQHDSEKTRRNAVIIDAGTALTVDWLTANGEHLGGWIVPGRRLMQESLHSGTANLNHLVTEECYRLPATNTQQGMSFGVHYALVGAISQALKASTQVFNGDDFSVVVTGGDGERLLKSLQHVEPVDYLRIDDLVFKGLLSAADNLSSINSSS